MGNVKAATFCPSPDVGDAFAAVDEAFPCELDAFAAADEAFPTGKKGFRGRRKPNRAPPELRRTGWAWAFVESERGWLSLSQTWPTNLPRAERSRRRRLLFRMRSRPRR